MLNIPGSSKKTAILRHAVTSYLIPPCPLDQCCCPMHAGIRTEMAVFFEGLSKQSDVATLNWGKGGMQVSSQWVWQDGCFFWRTRTQSGKDFLVYGCANTSLNKLPFAFAKTSIQSHFHLQSFYPANKEAQDLSFWVDGFANASLNKFPFARAKTQSKHTFIFTAATHKQRMFLHPSRSRNCTNCVFCSARTVHVQCTHSARHSARRSARPQNAVNTMGLAFFWQFSKKKRRKNIFFWCSHHFWENTWYLQRFVAVHCGVHCSVHCACTVRALCKTRCLCPLLFSAAERCNSASGGAEAHSTLVHHARHTASDPQFLPTCGANAAMLHLCLWVAAVKMKMCLDWVLARANGNLFKLAFAKPSKIFLVYGCANTSLNKLPFAFAKTSIQSHFHLQSFYPANKEAQDLSFWVDGFANASLNKFPFARAKTQSNTLSSSQLLPTNKECSSTPPEAEIAQTACFAVHVQCTYSARTVHGTVHAAVHGHKTL